MPSSPSSKIIAANIPNITALRNDLDYGNSKLPRCMGFYDDIRVFRKNYHTSQGVPGLDLWDWKSSEHHAGLTEMTEAYLEKQGNGLKYWPDDDASPNRNKYRYTEDKARIKRLVKQLFFRLNQQQYRNNKYKHKDRIEPSDPDGRGGSVETAIDVDSIQAIPTSPSKRASAIRTSKGKSIETKSTPTVKQNGSPKSNGTPRQVHHEARPSSDIYAGPDSEPSQSPVATIRSFEAINRAASAKRSLHHMNATAQRYQSKRQKKDATSSPAKSTAAAPEDNASANIERLASYSSRPHKPVVREGYVGIEGIDAFLANIDRASSTAESQSQGTSQHDLRATVEDSNEESDDPFRTFPLPRSEERQLPTGVNGAAPQSVESNIAPLLDTSQARFEPIATPSSVADSSKDGRPDNEEQPRPQTSPPQSTTATPKPESSANCMAAPPKPSVTFVYRVMHTSSSTEKRLVNWEPRGRFQDKTLAELIGELGFDDPAGVRGLVFTIELPGLQAVESILRDNEDGFESMKRLINRSIREWFSQRRQSGGGDARPTRLVVDMFIEKMGDESRESPVKGEDIDISW